MIGRALLAALLILGLLAPASAQVSDRTRFSRNLVPPTTSAANTAQTYTITGLAGFRVRVWSITAVCSAGSAALSMTDGGATVFSWAGHIGTQRSGIAWMTPYSAGLGNTVIITVGACGAGNTSTLEAQADQSTP